MLVKTTPQAQQKLGFELIFQVWDEALSEPCSIQNPPELILLKLCPLTAPQVLRNSKLKSCL